MFNKARNISLGITLYLLRGTYRIVEEDIDDDEEAMVLLLIKSTSRLRGSLFAPPRLKGFLDEVVPRCTFRQFQSHFRIDPATANELENRIAPFLARVGVEGRLPVDPRTQILVCIWVLANPDSYRSMEVQFGIGKASLHRYFLRVVHALCDISSEVICWPKACTLENIKEAFYAKAGMPDVIGAIDGSHIEIDAPQVDAASYRTSKKKYAVQLQAVCDASLRFTDCFVGYPGAVHDARVLCNSPLYKDAMINEQVLFPRGEYIIGDKGYQPVRTWLITPYKDNGALNETHMNFNNILSRTRQVIERAFALLKGRFRRLKHLHMNSIHEIPHTILACCVLHNLCLQGLHETERDLEDYIRDGEENENEEERNMDDDVQLADNINIEEENLCEQLEHNINENATPGQRKRNYLKDRLT